MPDTALPSLRGLPLVGHLHAYRTERLGLLLRASRAGADICSFRLGPATMVLVTSPQLIQQILVADAEAYEKGDLLSMLLAARDQDDGSFMTDQQVRDEAMTLFLAGHETTTNALTWTWHLLSRHPEVSDRLRAEIDEVLAGRTPTITLRPKYGLRIRVRRR